MNRDKNLKIKEWEVLFGIDKLNISDLKGWSQYCFNEGLASEEDYVSLSMTEAISLSNISIEKFDMLWENYK